MPPETAGKRGTGGTPMGLMQMRKNVGITSTRSRSRLQLESLSTKRPDVTGKSGLGRPGAVLLKEKGATSKLVAPSRRNFNQQLSGTSICKGAGTQINGRGATQIGSFAQEANILSSVGIHRQRIWRSQIDRIGDRDRPGRLGY